MSRAFIKESDLEETSGLPDLPQSAHINYVTPSGLRQLKSKIRELTALRDALTAGDGLGAEQQLAGVERDLRYLNHRVECAVLIDPATQPIDRVHFGACVTVMDEDGAQHTFEIVGEDEAHPDQDKISYVSPLASALLDHRRGDEVVWHRPAGDLRLEIVNIRNAPRG